MRLLCVGNSANVSNHEPTNYVGTVMSGLNPSSLPTQAGSVCCRTKKGDAMANKVQFADHMPPRVPYKSMNGTREVGVSLQLPAGEHEIFSGSNDLPCREMGDRTMGSS